MRRVLIVKSGLEPFRVPFYSRLRKRLALDGIELRVTVPAASCATYHFPWLIPTPAAGFSFLGKKVCWQWVTGYARQSDLVVVQQSASELTNYALLLARRASEFKLAVWGHGTEFHRSWTTPLARRLKSRLFSTVDFWFAYTPWVADFVARTGYPRERICTVFNSVDTESEQHWRQQVSEAQKSALRARLGMAAASRLICFCGSLYRAKRLEFLMETCELLRRSGLDLHLAVLGEGAELHHLRRISLEASWLHVLGAVRDHRKALLLSASECMVIPGVVGLALVDAFVHECPLITTDIQGHGPEIEYLINGCNGLTVADDIPHLAGAIGSVLQDPRLRSVLQRGCREAALKFTMGNMVEHFAEGVLAALRLPSFRELKAAAGPSRIAACH